MTGPPQGATKAAARVLARARAEDSEGAGYSATVGTICEELSAGLSRWIGAEGYRALRGRALDEVRPAHPALDRLSFDGTDVAEIAVAVETHGAAPVALALEAFIASLIGLLGRIIGDEMAANLIESAGVGAQKGVGSERGIDD